MLVKSMSPLPELHDDPRWPRVAQIGLAVPLSQEELVAAAWSGLAPEDDPYALPLDRFEAAVVYALTFIGLHEVQQEAERLAARSPVDADERWFLDGCRVRVAELLTAWSPPSAGRVLVGAAA